MTPKLLVNDNRVSDGISRAGRAADTHASDRAKPSARASKTRERPRSECMPPVFAAQNGVRIVPLAHGGTAIDVDFAEELDVLEKHWDDLKMIAQQQDRASRAEQSS